LDVALNAADKWPRAIAAPRIQTQDNVAAQIQAGTQIPFQTRINSRRRSPTSTQRFVTPQITEAGTVIMDIQVQKNDPGPTAANAPGPSQRAAHSPADVRDGGTAVIAGIYQTNETNLRTDAVPLYDSDHRQSLPRRTTSTDASELLIFITPRTRTVVGREEEMDRDRSRDRRRSSGSAADRGIVQRHQ
jgi:type IV pilus assembly protein PilQ